MTVMSRGGVCFRLASLRPGQHDCRMSLLGRDHARRQLVSISSTPHRTVRVLVKGVHGQGKVYVEACRQACAPDARGASNVTGRPVQAQQLAPTANDLWSCTMEGLPNIGRNDHHNSSGGRPRPFPGAVLWPGRREPSPIPANVGNGKTCFMLVSEETGRRWHVRNSVKACQFGEVFRAVELIALPSGVWGYSHEQFAIKVMNKNTIYEVRERSNEEPLKEAAVLQHMSMNGAHPNVITYTEAGYGRNAISLNSLPVQHSLTDWLVGRYCLGPGRLVGCLRCDAFCEGGELLDRVSMNKRIGELEARPLFRQVLDGVAFLQRNGVCHRDLSLENLLLYENGALKIIDFGMALQVPLDAAGRPGLIVPLGPCGKANYMAPEIFSSEEGFDGFKVDVWACGIILFIMLIGVPPFEVPSPAQDARCLAISVHRRLTDVVRGWNMPLSASAMRLIQSCLLYEPIQRPSIEELRCHPWVCVET